MRGLNNVRRGGGIGVIGKCEESGKRIRDCVNAVSSA